MIRLPKKALTVERKPLMGKGPSTNCKGNGGSCSGGGHGQPGSNCKK